MNTGSAATIAVAVFFFLTITASAAERKKAARPVPEIKRECSICHGSHDTAAPTPALIKPLSQLCLDCHPDRTAPNEHRVDVAPKNPVPGLPLTDGKMTCVTCHDPHRNEHGTMLRVNQQHLCLRCHPF